MLNQITPQGNAGNCAIKCMFSQIQMVVLPALMDGRMRSPSTPSLLRTKMRVRERFSKRKNFPEVEILGSTRLKGEMGNLETKAQKQKGYILQK